MYTIDVNNVGEGGTYNKENTWKSAVQYFSFNHKDGDTISVNRTYGGLDVTKNANDNEYHILINQQIVSKLRWHYAQASNQFRLSCSTDDKCNVNISLESQDQLLVIYNFLDLRINQSIYKNKINNETTIIIDKDPLISRKFYDELGFTRERDNLSITKELFNANKDQWIEKINAIDIGQMKEAVGLDQTKRVKEAEQAQHIRIEKIKDHITQAKALKSNICFLIKALMYIVEFFHNIFNVLFCQKWDSGHAWQTQERYEAYHGTYDFSGIQMAYGDLKNGNFSDVLRLDNAIDSFARKEVTY